MLTRNTHKPIQRHLRSTDLALTSVSFSHLPRFGPPTVVPKWSAFGSPLTPTHCRGSGRMAHCRICLHLQRLSAAPPARQWSAPHQSAAASGSRTRWWGRQPETNKWGSGGGERCCPCFRPDQPNSYLPCSDSESTYGRCCITNYSFSSIVPIYILP